MNRLSVCIPTYNREQFIGETIDSILAQATDEVEIVISDNGSDDNTEELVRRYQRIFPRIRYFRWGRNVGADRNYLKVIELATGDYCWFMGSDDRLAFDAIFKVMAALNRYPSLTGVTVGVSGWDLSFSRTLRLPVYIPKGEYIFTKSSDIVSNLGCYFGYLSGLIVQRSSWVNAAARLEKRSVLYRYPAYAHVQVTLEMLEIEPRWLSISEPLVQFRSGNDSFSGDGILRRFELDVVGHSGLIKDIYGRNSIAYRSCAGLACSTWHRARLVDAKKKGLSTLHYIRALAISFPMYWDILNYWILILASLTPRLLFELIRKFRFN